MNISNPRVTNGDNGAGGRKCYHRLGLNSLVYDKHLNDLEADEIGCVKHGSICKDNFCIKKKGRIKKWVLPE